MEFQEDVTKIQGEERSNSFRSCGLNEHVRIVKTLYVGGSTNRYGIILDNTSEHGLIEFSDETDDEFDDGSDADHADCYIVRPVNEEEANSAQFKAFLTRMGDTRFEYIPKPFKMSRKRAS